MSSLVSESVFSVPFRHLWSTSFTGETTAVTGSPNGLARFVGDDANRLLRFFAGSTIASITKPMWPLVFFGPSGTGKTSLAMSIIAEIADQSSSQPLFMSARDFDRRFRSALEMDAMDDFLEQFASASGVVIDDVHQLANKPTAQHQLVRVLDFLLEKNRPFLVTMDQSPSLCQQLDARLTSRLCAGLSLPVHPPGPDARKEIIRDLATINQIQFTNDAIDLIIDRLNVTVPKLDHFFAQLALAIKADGTIDTEDAIDALVLTRLFSLNENDVDRMAALISKTVAAEFYMKVADLRSNRRNQTIVLARGIAVFLMRSLLGVSFQKIGVRFGNRDHSTILHAFRKIESMIADDDNPSSPHHQTVRQVKRMQQSLAEQFASENRFV